MGQILGIVAAALPLILAESFGEILGSSIAGWSAMAACFGIFSVFPILLTWRTTRGYELFPDKPEFMVQTPTAAMGIKLLYCLGPVVFLGIAIIIAYFMPMTQDKHEELTEILKLKKKNKNFDLAPIENLM